MKSLVEIDQTAANLAEKIKALQHRAQLVLDETELKPGDPVFLVEARKMASTARKAKSTANRDRLRPIISHLRSKGFKTYRQLADELNRQNIEAPAAKSWSPGSVYAVEKRP